MDLFLGWLTFLFFCSICFTFFNSPILCYFMAVNFITRIGSNNKNQPIINLENYAEILYFLLQMGEAKYIEYLQSLLNENKISFKGLKEFDSEANQKIQKQQTHNHPKGPLETNIRQPLTSSLIQRYSRQMLLKEIAYEGQTKIINTKIAIIGSGGIGCPVALYLAAAGVGTIGLFDSDKVDVTNLHRQIGHRTSTVGLQKTTSLKNTLLDINPFIEVKEHPFITVQTASTLDQYDLVIDGSDNPTCRYIVNDYCMKNNRKLLSGACIGWEAQITCYGGKNLCYRCLWGNQQVSLGGCSTLGVVGMLPGLVGMILATQAIKIILNGQSSLEGRLLTFDGRKCEFKKVQLRKKQVGCIGCGNQKLDMSTYDYAKYGACQKKPVPDVPKITWQNYVDLYYQRRILDVRPLNQYDIVHLTNSFNIPFEKLSKMSKEEIIAILGLLEKPQVQIPVSCTRGVMSRHAVKYLSEVGIKAVSIQGGILGYRSLYDQSIPEI